MQLTSRLATVSIAVLISFGVSGCSDFIEIKPQPGQSSEATESPAVQAVTPSPKASSSHNASNSETSEIREVRSNATETLNKIHQLALSEEFEDLLNDPNFSGSPSIDEPEMMNRINDQHGYFMSELRSVAYVSVNNYSSDPGTEKQNQTAQDLILLNEFYRFTKELKGENYTFEVGPRGITKRGGEYYMASEYVYFKDSQGRIMDTLGKKGEYQLDNMGKRLDLSYSN